MSSGHKHPYKAISSVYGKIDTILMAANELNDYWERRITGIRKAFADRNFVFLGFFDSDISEAVYPPNEGLTSDKNTIEKRKKEEALFEQYFSENFKLSPWKSTKSGQVKSILLSAKNAGLIKNKRAKEISYVLNQFDLRAFLPASMAGIYSTNGPRYPRIGPWIQDPFVILQDDRNQSMFLEPFYYDRFDYQFVAEQVGEQMDIPILPFKLALDGGNMLFGDDYALLGRNLLYKSYLLRREEGVTLEDWIKRFDRQDDAATDELIQEITEYYAKKLGFSSHKNIYWIGWASSVDSNNASTINKQYQPLFHIDLFITLAGKHPGTGKETVIVANIKEYSIAFQPTAEEQQKIDKVRNGLNDVAAHFDDDRFHVERIPLGVSKCEGQLVYKSYNNCLVEVISEKEKNVYLPKYYSLNGERVEKDVLSKFSELGFHGIHLISGPFDDWSDNKGSLNCITKVLRRS